MQELLQSFHDRRIAHVYPQPHYVYDAYIDTENRVSVIDFDALSGDTNFALFAKDVSLLYLGF